MTAAAISGPVLVPLVVAVTLAGFGLVMWLIWLGISVDGRAAARHEREWRQWWNEHGRDWD